VLPLTCILDSAGWLNNTTVIQGHLFKILVSDQLLLLKHFFAITPFPFALVSQLRQDCKYVPVTEVWLCYVSDFLYHPLNSMYLHICKFCLLPLNIEQEQENMARKFTL
jgi:hypothetical protein